MTQDRAQRLEFASSAGHVGSYGGQSGTGAVSLQVIQFSTVSIIPPLLHIH
jgi:hypothetical protein